MKRCSCSRLRLLTNSSQLYGTDFLNSLSYFEDKILVDDFQDWIANYRKKLNSSVLGPQPPKRKLFKKLTGNDVFKREFLKENPLHFKEAAEKWHSMTEEEKSQYNAQAAEELGEPLPNATLEDKKRTLKRVKNTLASLVNEMNFIGLEMLVVMTDIDRTKLVSLGTNDAETLFDENAVLRNSFMKAWLVDCGEERTRLSKAVLRKKVQCLFKEKYKGNKELSYNKNHAVIGLPQGIEFKHPGNYGRLQLEAILSNAGSIEITDGEEDGEDENEQNTSQEVSTACQEGTPEDFVNIEVEEGQYEKVVVEIDNTPNEPSAACSGEKSQKKTTRVNEIKKLPGRSQGKDERHKEKDQYVIEQLFEMINGKQEWFTGEAVKRKGVYIVSWEDGKTTRINLKKAKIGLRQKTLKIMRKKRAFL